MERRVLLGRIGAPWGVHGWLKVESYTDPPGALLKYPHWQLAGAGSVKDSGAGAAGPVVRLLEGRPFGGKRNLLVRLHGLDSPEVARQYSTLEIWVPRAELPPAAPNEYYWVDLIGLDVVTLDGVALGKVSHFVELPANPVLVVKQGGKEHWVPMAPAHVKRVDLAARRVEVDWEPLV